MIYSPDGSLLASGGVDDAIGVWDPGARVRLGTLEGHGANVNALAFSPDGNLLASGSGDTSAILWGPPERQPVAQLRRAQQRGAGRGL